MAWGFLQKLELFTFIDYQMYIKMKVGRIAQSV